MGTTLLAKNDLLTNLRRFTFGVVPGERPANLEYLCLAGCGVAAGAAVALVDFSLKIPGHAILRAIVPLICGLALVPRHGAGSFMSLTAASTALGLHGWEFGRQGWNLYDLPLGSFTSLLLAGPCLDLAVRNAQAGWKLYLRVAAVGVLVNWIALAARMFAYYYGYHLLGGRTAGQFLARAGWTYTLCGALAGLLTAWLVFRNEPPDAAETLLTEERAEAGSAEGFAHDSGGA